VHTFFSDEVEPKRAVSGQIRGGFELFLFVPTRSVELFIDYDRFRENQKTWIVLERARSPFEESKFVGKFLRDPRQDFVRKHLDWRS
jgi:hypothetical protein